MGKIMPEMPRSSVERDLELKEVFDRLSEAADVALRGEHPRVHVAISSPPLGGLTTFLKDLDAMLRADGRFLPLLVQPTGGADGEAGMVEAVRTLAIAIRAAGLTVRDDIEQEHTLFALFELANKLRSDKGSGRLVVLITDASSALSEIAARDDLRTKARGNPLLARLRIAATSLTDQEPNIALVVGWHDDFPRNSPDWMAQDVVQRYQPNYVLWPDFQRDDAWPVYREILAKAGFSVAGDYPGFCRSEVPVGMVLRALRETNDAGRPVPAVDGKVLLGVLRQAGKTDEDLLRRFDSDVVVALCLQDQSIAGGPLLEKVRGPAFRAYVEPSAERGYQATEDLYRAAGTRPVNVIMSLEKRTLRRFEVDRDPQLAAEILRGAAAMLCGGTPPDVQPAPVGEYARIDLNLPVKLLPTGARAIKVSAFCTVARDISHELTEDMAAVLKEVETNPAARARRLILFLHSEPTHDNTMSQRLMEVARERKFDIETVNSTVRGDRSQQPAALSTLELTGERAVQAVYLSRDPQAPAGGFVDAMAKALKFSALLNKWPPITLKLFEGNQVLAKLIVHAHEPFRLEDLRLNPESESGELTQGEARDILAGLVKLGAVEKVEGSVFRWTYSGDGFLAKLRAAVEANPTADAVGKTLSRSYFFDLGEWPELLQGIAAAYSADLLRVNGNTITLHDPTTRVRERFRELMVQAKAVVETVRASGSDAEAAELHSRIQDAAGGEASVDGSGAATPGSLDAACGRMFTLLCAAKDKLGELDERRRGLLAELGQEMDAAKKIADTGEKAADDTRTAAVSAAEAAANAKETNIGRLDQALAGLRNAAVSARKAARARTRNINDARTIRDDATRVLEKATHLVSQHRNATLGQPLEQASAAVKKILDALGGDAHPKDVTAEARANELDRIRQELELQVGKLIEIERELARARVRPSPQQRVTTDTANPKPQVSGQVVGPTQTSNHPAGKKTGLVTQGRDVTGGVANVGAGIGPAEKTGDNATAGPPTPATVTATIQSTTASPQSAAVSAVGAVAAVGAPSSPQEATSYPTISSTGATVEEPALARKVQEKPENDTRSPDLPSRKPTLPKTEERRFLPSELNALYEVWISGRIVRAEVVK